MVKMTFTKACLTYFGRLPGQTAIDFGREIKALTPKDREDLKKDFAAIGVEIDSEAPAATT